MLGGMKTESENEPPALDWIHAPPGVEVHSYWTCLHDGYVERIRSHRARRTVELQVDVFYIRGHFGLSDSTRFHFNFREVAAVRVQAWVSPPEDELEPSQRLPPSKVRSQMTISEQNRLIAAFHSLSRWESLPWEEFERRINPDFQFEVLDANLISSAEGLAVRLKGPLDGEGWYRVEIAAQEVEVLQDGAPISLHQFRTMGQAYWDAFGSRQKSDASES
jgi:hypothetical protein